MRRIMTFMFVLVGLITLTTTTASAKTPAPTVKVLGMSRAQTQKREMALLKKYRINLAYQTGFSRRHQVWVYNLTGSKDIQTSLNEARRYWNDEFGRSVFNVGSFNYHTVTVRFTYQKSRTDRGLACWSPATKTLKINLDTYENELKDIKRYMKRHYLAKPHDSTLEPQAFEKIDTSAASKARNVEYARILTHEFGHILGLAHSTNHSDLMYSGLGFGDIYDIDRASQPIVWDNPLTPIDVSRGRLGLKLAKLN